MSSVVNYANNDRQCFCQIFLDSGERILISMAARPTPNTKIFKLGFFGVIPTKTIWAFTVEMAGDNHAYIHTLMTMFEAFGEPLKHPLDAVRDVLLNCSSIAEVRQEIKRRESGHSPIPPVVDKHGMV
jgi:hypothetical protein